MNSPNSSATGVTLTNERTLERCPEDIHGVDEIVTLDAHIQCLMPRYTYCRGGELVMAQGILTRP